MMNWNTVCNALNCEHIYYVYGCEANCALNKKCDKMEEYLNKHDELTRRELCGTCKGYQSIDLCHICSRNYRDMYRA